jgi:tetratricopeptide (TPR) repeat protein
MGAMDTLQRAFYYYNENPDFSLELYDRAHEEALDEEDFLALIHAIFGHASILSDKFDNYETAIKLMKKTKKYINMALSRVDETQREEAILLHSAIHEGLAITSARQCKFSNATKYLKKSLKINPGRTRSVDLLEKVKARDPF